jgi:hypothetical protein
VQGSLPGDGARQPRHAGEGAGLPAGGTPLELGVSSVAGLTTRGIHGRRRGAVRGGRRERGGTRALHMSSSATTLATVAPDSEMGGKRGTRGLRIWPGWTQRRPELGDRRGGAPPSLDVAMVARGSLPRISRLCFPTLRGDP